jgi:hypothetical protein
MQRTFLSSFVSLSKAYAPNQNRFCATDDDDDFDYDSFRSQQQRLLLLRAAAAAQNSYSRVVDFDDGGDKRQL